MARPRTSANVGAAVDHLLWCAEHQGGGYFPIRILREDADGHLRVVATNWFDNRDPRLAQKLTGALSKYEDGRVTVLYSPCAFSKKHAKAQYALPNRVAYVDADEGCARNACPEPTRIVKSSEGGEHWFWVLSDELSPDELQSLNRALTCEIGGDKGGHSPAKLFRLPGFDNRKYNPAYRVAVFEDTGEVYDADDLRASVQRGDTRAGQDRSSLGDALSISTRLSPDRVFKQFRHKLHLSTVARLRQRAVYGPFTIRHRGRETAHYLGDDRSEIIWGIALDFRRAGANPAEVLAVVINTVFWRARERSGKAEDPERFVERIFDFDLANGGDAEIKATSTKALLEAIDPAIWEGLPRPIRRWIIKEWIPLQKVTLLYGDGGTGKTLLVLMLAVAVALGHDFLGLKVERGRVLLFLGENDEIDTHIALADICRHYGVSLGDLKGRIRVASRSGMDNVFMHFNKGTGKHTALFKEIVVSVTAFDADLVVLETAADLFGGNENARGEVRQFVANCCEVIAKEANAAVILCAHPSVAGLRSGDGTAGSTAWSNSARSRLYLRRDIDADGHEADQDFRVLSRMKANFAQRTDSIDLCWRDGVFVVNDPVKNRAAVTDIDRKLIDEVARAFDAGSPWSAHHQAGHRHVVRWIAMHLKQSPKAATKMLTRLMSDGRLVEAVIDAHTHRKGLCTPEQALNVPRNKADK